MNGLEGFEGKRKENIGNYHVGRVIGKGTFGTVFIAQDKASNQVFAIKSILKSKITTEASYLFLRSEKEILSQLSSPFAVSYFGCFQDDSSVYFKQEFIPGGELFSLITRQQFLSVRQSKFIMSEIVLFLNHLHDKGIVYRDLKPENILISSTGHVKIVDFGFASKSEEHSKTFCGTVEYLSPEIIKRKPHGTEVDWWTCGVLLFEMLTGRSPFGGKSSTQTFERILNQEPIFPSRVDSDAKDLISKLLQKDPQKRIKGEEVQKHQFFKDIDWHEVEKMSYPTFQPPSLRTSLDASYFPHYNEKKVLGGSVKYSFEGFDDREN
jgi:serine/threonine protein kinase